MPGPVGPLFPVPTLCQWQSYERLEVAYGIKRRSMSYKIISTSNDING
jgi:hypothetical protein